MSFIKILKFSYLFAFIFLVIILTETTFIAAQTTAPCEREAELVLLLDSSGSVAAEQPAIAQFATDLASRFVISPTSIRMGIVRYGATSEVISGLLDTTSAVNAAINVPYSGEIEGTNIVAGMADAGFVLSGTRTDVARFAVHLTDGRHNTSDLNEAIQAAMNLNAGNTWIFGVDYGDTPDLVQQMSSIVFVTGGLGVDQLSAVVDSIARAVCNAPQSAPTLGEIQAPEPSLAADGRVNPDPAASAVIYCTFTDDIELTFPGTGSNFIVSKAEIEAVPTNPATNTLIAATPDNLWRLYRLTTGQFQLNGPSLNPSKEYVVIWDGCPHTATNWFEVEY